MKGILLASFGTSYQTARENHIDPLARLFSHTFPEARVAQAYTSDMIRRILEKRGIFVPDVAAALDAFAEEGIEEVAIQPGHLLPGAEYDKLCAHAESRRAHFKALRIGRPLLGKSEDFDTLAHILSAHYPAKANTGLVLIGHGTPQFANVAYAALDYHFKAAGRKDVFVGALEAYPGLGDLLPQLKQYPSTQLVLAPLMQVAGDHAQNDMAGEEPDSWASQLKSAGYEVQCQLAGLGGLPEVQKMYLAHLQEVL